MVNMRSNVTLNDRNHNHRRAYLSIGNNSLTVTKIEYSNPKIETGLDGFKIVHISDLHNHRFGASQSKLVLAVWEQRPDIIVVTGDSIDRRRTDIKAAMEFYDQAVMIAPVCFVTGNHEELSGRYDEFKTRLISAGVCILENRLVTLNHKGSLIKLIGLSDACSFGFVTKLEAPKALSSIRNTLKDLTIGDSCFSILLTHRPEFIDIYSECGVDLVLSGHAHGGQVRLPFIGGLFAPGQGVFPRYTSGIYYAGKTAMVVSRGLGNSIFPLRMFNPPDIVSLTLTSK